MRAEPRSGEIDARAIVLPCLRNQSDCESSVHVADNSANLGYTRRTKNVRQSDCTVDANSDGGRPCDGLLEKSVGIEVGGIGAIVRFPGEKQWAITSSPLVAVERR
jgi:hypothetical protein